MWMKIINPAIIVIFLTGIAAVAYAQDATTEGKSTTAPGIYPTDRPGPGKPIARDRRLRRTRRRRRCGRQLDRREFRREPQSNTRLFCLYTEL